MTLWNMSVMIFHQIVLMALLTVSQAQDAVIISPPILVAAVNDSSSTTFTLLSPIGLNEGGIASIQWLLDGLLLEDLSLNNVNSTFVSDGGGFGTLSFSRVQLDQNSTSVSCTVHFMSGRVETSSDSALLLVQGLLSTVNDLTIAISNSTLALTWEPPFTLDITVENPDITGYCVDVINSTSSVTLHSEYGTNETKFSYLLPRDAVCHSYIFTITPVNIVGRGAPNSVSYKGTEAEPNDVLYVESISDSDVTNGKPNFSFIIIMSAPVCVAEVISLVNLDTGTQESVADSELTITEDFAIMFTIPLPVNHHYNVTIRARNGAGTANASTELSTHDIQAAEILPSTINITYFTGSNARGALLNQVCSMHATSTFQMLDRSSQFLAPYNYTAPTCSGPIQIFLYDIEQSGVLSRGRNYPAVKERVAANRQGTDVLPEPILIHLRNCSIETSPPFITAKCAYPGDSGTMVTGFQVIAQPADFDRLGKIYANYTSEGQTSAVVEVEQNGEFLVSVIPVLGETGIINSSVKYSEVVVMDDLLTSTSVFPSNEEYVLPVAILTGVMAVTVMLVLIFLCVCAKQKICCFKKKNDSGTCDENDYGPAPRNNSTLPTEPNGEGEDSTTVSDSEQLQQQPEQAHAQQNTEQKDEIYEENIAIDSSMARED